jgi:hypothetical protein
MEEVDPSKLIPGEYYYLEDKRNKTNRGKGKFFRYFFSEMGGGKQAAFRIVPTEKIKSKNMNYSNDVRGFPVASYKFYKPLPEGFIDRYQQKVEEDRLTALEIMLNQQKLPMRPDKISASSMFAQTPEEKNPPFIEDDQTFYGADPVKSSLGTQLKDTYSAYLLDKKGGRRKSRQSRKSRKSRKTRKTKSRRRH